MARPRFGTRGALILAAIIALGVGWVLLNRAETAPDTEAGDKQILTAVPADAILVASLDLAALRNEPAGELLLGRGRKAAGLGQLQQLCGSDPLDAADALALAIPERSDTGFGLFAQGRFNADGLLGCAERVLSQRGGRPVRQPYEGFSVLRDASAKRGSAELAVSSDGLLVMAEPAYVRASLAARAKPDGSIAQHPEHNALRAAVGPATLLASVILSQQLRLTLVDELRAQGMANSPFATIRAAALGVRLGQRVELTGLLRCDDEARCADAARMLDRTRQDEAGSPFAKALGIGRLLAELRVEAAGRDIRLRGDLSLEETGALLDRLTVLGRLQGLAPPRRQLPARPAPAAPLPLPATSATAAPSAPATASGGPVAIPLKPTPRPPAAPAPSPVAPPPAAPPPAAPPPAAPPPAAPPPAAPPAAPLPQLE